MPALAPISTSGDWRVKKESEHVAWGSPRGISTYHARSHTSCRDRICLGGSAWESLTWELPLVPCQDPAALPFFFFILVESQGKPKLGIQNSPVTRLKQKQTLGVVVVSISEVFYF